MKIERTIDMEVILKCLPFEREIRNKGRDTTRESKMLMFVQSQLQNPLFGFWVAYNDEEEIVGYTVAMASLVPSMEKLHLMRMYAKTTELKEALLEVLHEWAKALKIKTESITVRKHIKAFQRRYKFKTVSVNMERRI